MTTTSAVSGSARPDRSGKGGIVALHNERRSKSAFMVSRGIGAS
jgi:hypothetical protein